MNGILIDTNIYSEAMRGNQEVVAALRRVPHIGFSAISVGELLSGFKSGNREEKNRQELSVFLNSPRVRCMLWMRIQPSITALCCAVSGKRYADSDQ